MQNSIKTFSGAEMNKLLDDNMIAELDKIIITNKKLVDRATEILIDSHIKNLQLATLSNQLTVLIIVIGNQYNDKHPGVGVDKLTVNLLYSFDKFLLGLFERIEKAVHDVDTGQPH